MSINISYQPYCFTTTVLNGSSFNGANLTHLPQTCYGLTLDNLSNSETVSVQLNGNSNAQFVLPPNAAYQFSFMVSSVDFANTTSGAGSAIVQAICTVSSN